MNNWNIFPQQCKVNALNVSLAFSQINSAFIKVEFKSELQWASSEYIMRVMEWGGTEAEAKQNVLQKDLW